jgi:hypothetical protein
VDDRACLAGIVYRLHTGIPWRLLPTRELGCGSPVTCWRRLRDWQQLHHAGIPLAFGLSAANAHDSLLLKQVIDAVPPIKGSRGRPGRPRHPVQRSAGPPPVRGGAVAAVAGWYRRLAVGQAGRDVDYARKPVR